MHHIMWCYFILNVFAIYMVGRFYINAVLHCIFVFILQNSVMSNSKNQSHCGRKVGFYQKDFSAP